MKVDPASISEDAAYFWQIASIVPRPIAWTSTLNEDGTANLAPFSYFTGVSSHPPTCLICVAQRGGAPKDTWRNIARTREYVIHVVPFALAEKMNMTSGDYAYGVDEFERAGLSKTPSERVAPPRIAEAPVAMECRLDRIVEVGRDPVAVIIGEILLWHVRDDVLGPDGRMDMALLDPIGRMAGATYTRTRDRFTMPRPKVR